jgi:trehalose-6-phosphatase
LGVDKMFPVYIGDDITDEDGFRALRNKGLTIFVGKPKLSEAAYYVKNTKEAVQLIKQILENK